uniref:BPTI/Kunitz inhibitor domain-containing protein n=1 Tax=Dromaius novaehollandiae TaxID=8790 RepID=A0A8C4JDE6_DRONO
MPRGRGMRGGACQAFIYSGCGGNRNNFPSRRECQQACRKSGASSPRAGRDWAAPERRGLSAAGPTAAQVCRLPKVPGTCLAHIPSYFYNAATRRCERFIYKGCTGNENRFASEQECRRTCGRPGRSGPPRGAGLQGQFIAVLLHGTGCSGAGGGRGAGGRTARGGRRWWQPGPRTAPGGARLLVAWGRRPPEMGFLLQPYITAAARCGQAAEIFLCGLQTNERKEN